MGMLLHRHRPDKKPVEAVKPPVVQQEADTKDKAATVKRPGRPKKS